MNTSSSADTARLVILPSYNSGPLLAQTALSVLQAWQPVWVVLDGSTDESGEEIRRLAESHSGLKVLTLTENQGKGGAVLAAFHQAQTEGFTHALIMDADGQHPADRIDEFMELSRCHPDAMILGVPAFGPDAPPERVKGRRVGNWFANLETLWGGIDDSLFGFRLYPIEPSVKIMDRIRTARRFDFDTELAVRLFWAGVRPVNRSVAVTYPDQTAGGVTHFRYLRDNFLLVGTHTRLCFLLFPRLWRVWQLRTRWRSDPT